MTDRRSFLKQSSKVLGVLPFIHLLPPFDMAGQMAPKLDIYATNWGFTGSVLDFCARSSEAGYDGVELWTPAAEKMEELMEATEKYNLKLGLLAGNWGTSFPQQLSVFKASIDRAVQLKPTYINCHSGKDFYSEDQNAQFVDYAAQAEEGSKIPIYHETHRGRILYSAVVAKQFMERFPKLKVTLDISHWCCVHESLLADQKATVDMALNRTGHIHARVGFAEGPQIPDFEDEQFSQAVKTHFEWWDEVVRIKTSRGETVTITTEFGPPPYMWTSLGSAKPLADNWDVNVSMMHALRKRYA